MRPVTLDRQLQQAIPTQPAEKQKPEKSETVDTSPVANKETQNKLANQAVVAVVSTTSSNLNQNVVQDGASIRNDNDDDDEHELLL